MTENYHGFESGEIIKVGQAHPTQGHAEIGYTTSDGCEERLTGLVIDPEDPEVLLATRYSYNDITKEVQVERGRIRGSIREAGTFVWEHKKEVAGVASLAISVTIGTLWVRHRRR